MMSSIFRVTKNGREIEGWPALFYGIVAVGAVVGVFSAIAFVTVVPWAIGIMTMLSWAFGNG